MKTRWIEYRCIGRTRGAYLLLFAGLLALSMLLFFGCGGGGGGSAGGTGFPIALTALTASGRAVLPAGFKLAPNQLRVATGVDDEAVKSDGTFSLLSSGTGQTLAILQDAKGKAILFGFVDAGAAGSSPQAGGKGEISAKQTSVALLFYTLGLSTLPASQWQQALALVSQNPQSDKLAAVIAARVAANPTAINDGDAQITAAITAARKAMQPGSRAAVSAQARQGASSRALETPTDVCGGPVTRTVTVSRAGSGPGILIEPSGERSGLEVLQSDDGSGVVVVNHFRRRAAAFVYEMATVDDNGNRTNLTTPKEMTFDKVSLLTALQNAGSLSAPSHFLEIAPANTLNGTFGSLSDVMPALTAPPDSTIQDGAWVRAISDTIPLSPDGNAAKTIYKVIVVGPSFAQKNDVTTSALATDPALHLTAFAPEWQSVVTTLSREEYIIDLALPLISSIVLTQKFEAQLEAIRTPGIRGAGNLKNDVEMVQEFLAFMSGVPDMNTSVSNGDWSGALKIMMQTLVDSEFARASVTKILLNQITLTYPPNVFGPPKDLATELEDGMEKFSRAVAIVDLLLAIADTSKVAHDSIAALPVTDWDVTVTKLKVTLAPKTATVTASTTIATLTAGPGDQGDPKAPFVYHWTCTGNAGGLEDSTHRSGHDEAFDSTDAQVDYAESVTASDGQTDTVTVQVFTNNGTLSAPVKGDLIGSASSTITVSLNGNCNGPEGQPIISSCGDLTVPAVVAPGQTMTVQVTLHTGGLCGNGATLFLNGVGVSGVTLDGVSQPTSTVTIPGTSNGSGPSTHTVVYTIASDAKNCIGTSVPNANPNLFIPQIFGPWVVLQAGDGGNNSGWTSMRPFQVKR